MEIRAATLLDTEALGRGMKAVVEEGRWVATEAGTPADELSKRYRRALVERQPLFVLEDDGEVVGCLGLRATGVDGVLSLAMWILSSHRGRGGGRMLIDAALAARPTGVHKLELEVWPDNEAAISLYSGMGFEREGLRRNHYRRQDGTLRSALIMSRLFE